MIIYKTTNLVNGKIYIGKHSKDDLNYLGSGILIVRAINKYGRENFIRETLEICTDDNINEREIYWIKEYNSIDKNIGYNLADGGQGGNTYKYKTHEELLLIREKISGEKNPMYGVIRSDEWKSNHSENMKGRFSGEKNPMYGVIRSDEWKSNHSENMKGRFSGEKNPMYGKKHNDDIKKRISQINKGKNAWNKGKNGIYSEETLNKMRCRKNNKKTIVLQYTLDMLFIKEWESITDAANDLGIRKSGIINCCKHRYSNSNGFVWRYKENEENGKE